AQAIPGTVPSMIICFQREDSTIKEKTQKGPIVSFTASSSPSSAGPHCRFSIFSPIQARLDHTALVGVA
ncbi:MAG: hypothetical protein ACKPKO_19285, partial [Candidatus Fonsibacter sp.]